ncbi:MAG: two-component sensor histidine kinase [Lachnospiraceae bacterium]|nr:two-component sensor histidine kinase [Lachnospiraceae bacterium]
MRKKINTELVLIAAVAIILTSILATFTYYRIFQTEVFGSLKTCAHVLAESVPDDDTDYDDYELIDETLRITLIAEDGTVLMDTNADIGEMSNHGERPEIKQAFVEGEGQEVRKSETVDKSTFYYAMRLKDGNVLRVAKETGSIFSMFMDAIPSLVGVAVLLFAFCTLLAHFLTKSFIAPIEKVAKNLDGQVDVGTYKELTPFLETIQEQHKNIIKSAKMRQNFTANVTHELKTPLTSISGYAELIESGMTGEKETRRFAKEIHRNAKRLIRLINDILQLSELDTLETKLETERLNLYGMAATCVEMLKINAEPNKVKMGVKGRLAWIEGNRSMIEELLYNLCSNAIRYNKPGGRVDVSVEENENGVLLKVADTGIGIPKKHQERIFERFYRVDKSRSKERGGTGLGLAIVKHIVAEHGATISLESEEGVGTTISVLFPRK